jgi:rhamnosyltransferase
MSLPSASVIVRALDSRADLQALLPVLRRQTVAAELVVVDSGSRDGSVEIATSLSDRLLHLAPGTYSPGRSLNLGAGNASGEVLLALSSHCRPPAEDWIERCLRHYARPDVGATNGASRDPQGRPLAGIFYQDGAHARANAHWGFSNHASSFRAEAWREDPFDEELVTSEDRLWAVGATARGWVIAHDPLLCVGQAHRYKQGVPTFFRRERTEMLVIGANVAIPPYPFSDLVRDWWSDVPRNDRYPPSVHRFLNYRRAAGLAGRYLGHRQARHIRR